MGMTKPPAVEMSVEISSDHLKGVDAVLGNGHNRLSVDDEAEGEACIVCRLVTDHSRLCLHLHFMFIFLLRSILGVNLFCINFIIVFILFFFQILIFHLPPKM